MDSVLKVVGHPYISLFAHTTPDIFITVWDGSNGTERSILGKVLENWTQFFDIALIDLLRNKVLLSQAFPIAVGQQSVPEVTTSSLMVGKCIKSLY